MLQPVTILLFRFSKAQRTFRRQLAMRENSPRESGQRSKVICRAEPPDFEAVREILILLVPQCDLGGIVGPNRVTAPHSENILDRGEGLRLTRRNRFRRFQPAHRWRRFGGFSEGRQSDHEQRAEDKPEHEPRRRLRHLRRRHAMVLPRRLLVGVHVKTNAGQLRDALFNKTATAIATVSVCVSVTCTCVAPTWRKSASPLSSSRTSGW